MKKEKENLNKLTGRYYDTSEFTDYNADVEKPLPILFQSGYLTIKSYNFEQNTFLLDFPNNEVKKGFITASANNYLQPSQEAGSWTRDADKRQLFKIGVSFSSESGTIEEWRII